MLLHCSYRYIILVDNSYIFLKIIYAREEIRKMEFKKLELEDKRVFNRFLNNYPFLSSEYSFANLFIWKDNYKTKYCIYEDTLIIAKTDSAGRLSFMEPIGYKEEKLPEIIKILKDLCREKGSDCLFREATEAFAEKIMHLNDEELVLFEDRDNFDYIYESEKLATLAGKKLHRKRNHYKAFVNGFDYKIINLSQDNQITKITDAIDHWYSSKEEIDPRVLHELKAIPKLLENMHLLNLQGIAVEVNEEIAAFTIGEKLNDDVAVIHIEKGNIDYKGVYSFINKTFVNECFKDVKYINREQDLGIEGLRKAKLSYYPDLLEKKFRINLI